ncbi:MAG: response regulator, partial [Acidobacteriota bacterium]
MLKKRLNVLLVEDDPDYVPLVQAWLAACPDAEFIVNWTDTLLTGLQRLSLGDIDAILLDLNLPDSSGAETFHGMHANAGAIPIVLLSASDSEALSMSLVLAGAQDYLVKEACDGRVLSRALLHGVLRQSARATADSPEHRETSRLVGLLGAKGGVGASTLASTLAAELGRVTLQDTLLADLDLQANSLSFLLGLPARRTIADALSNISHLDRSCWSSIVTSGPENMQVLESSDLMGAAGPPPDKLVQLFHFVRLYYPWTVLDLGRLGPVASAMLPILSHILLVTTDHVSSLNQARRMLELLR